ncbi:MAG TPA: DoxX family membrane protein [Candidatus Limnocylindrales bacterium]|nr:DoxX family membrane protein [Candidatus Limnocylindrales bacterium]
MDIISRKSLSILRVSLGICMLWFGVLKLFAVSSSLGILQSSVPPVLGQSVMFGFLVALTEIWIGISFLINKMDRLASLVTVIYLSISTVLLLIIHGFDPRFPVLSIVGESVLKNLVLIAGSLVLLSEKNPATTIDRDLKYEKPA